jgi:Secretion system C-terminal sorting domain
MKKHLLLAGALLCYEIVYCQSTPDLQTSCTTASQGTAGNFIISYTIGEMPLIQSWQSNGLLITQGILQPSKGIADDTYECFNQAEVKVFPNPGQGIFSLQLSILKKGNAKTVLFDAAGKQLQTEEFIYNSFSFTKQYNISKLTNGVYYLQLFFTESETGKSKKCIYTIQKIN